MLSKTPPDDRGGGRPDASARRLKIPSLVNSDKCPSFDPATSCRDEGETRDWSSLGIEASVTIDNEGREKTCTVRKRQGCIRKDKGA